MTGLKNSPLDIVFDPESAITLVEQGVEFVIEGIGPVSKFLKLIKGVQSARDAFFLKKLSVFLEEFSRVSVPVRGQVLSNLRGGRDENYFNESLFSAIDTADSSRRSLLLARLLGRCVNGDLPVEEYQNVLFVLKNINLPDLDSLDIALRWQERLLTLKEEAYVDARKEMEEQVGMRTLLRFQSVALARSSAGFGVSPVPAINIDFARIVLKAISDS